MATLGRALAVNRLAANTVFPAKARAPAAPRPMQVTRTALVPLPHHHGVAALVALARSLANIVGAPLSSMQACRKGLTIKVVPDMRVRACVRCVSVSVRMSFAFMSLSPAGSRLPVLTLNSQPQSTHLAPSPMG